MCKRLLLIFLSLSVSLSYAQTKKIVGRIFGEDNKPLSGVTIQLKNTKTFATSDNDGAFTINVSEKAKLTFKVSHVGYETQEVQAKGDVFPEVTMKLAQSNLDAVVVVGYGTSKKKDLTGSVEKLNIKDISKAPVRSFEEALGGRAAGVQVVSSDGQPGSAVNIVIRGNNSITQDNSPLYVIDGFPVESTNANAINVSEIESIEVLKDASATAIYGARGANGVIMITTKKGKAGKTEINYNYYIGINQIIKKMDVLSPYEFVRYQFENDSSLTKSTYLDPTIPGATIDTYKNANGVDWQNLLFRNAKTVSHEIVLRGGNDKTTFSMSGSYLSQEGIVLFSGYDRYQGRVRIDQKVNDKLKVGINLNYSALKSYGTIPSSLNSSSSSSSNLMFSVWGYRPVSGNPNVDLTAGIDPSLEADLLSGNDARFNPLETVQFEVRNRFSNVLSGNLNLDYQIKKNLTFKTTLGYISTADRNEEFNGTRTRSGSPFTSSGRLNGVNGSLIYNTKTNFANENTLTYSYKNGNDNLDVVLGATVQTNEQSIFGGAASQLPHEELGLSGLDEGTPTKISAYRSSNTLLSYLGRVNYNFDSKYLMTLSMRSDGSSKFSANNKWSYFPSWSIAWRFSNEEFLKSWKFLKEGKLRLSEGIIGNNRVSDFAYLSTSSTLLTLSYPFNSTLNSSVIPSALGNPDLRWETTSQTNLGLDLSLFDDKISITTDVYQKVTYDLLLNAQLPASSGFTQAYKNIGSVENKGLEFTLNTKNINKDNFTWSTSFNISFNRNKVLALSDGQESLLTSINWDNNWRNMAPYIAKVGQPLGMMYGLIWDGNYQYSDFNISGSNYNLKPTVAAYSASSSNPIQPGFIKYKDLNGDRIINDDDMTIIGDANPDFIGGFTNNFKFHGFDVNIFFQFSYGGDILNANRLVFEGNSGRSLQNQFTTVLNRWTPDNPNNEIFKTNGDGPYQYSSRVVEDGSYVRLKTLQVGYEIPEKLLKKMNVKSLRFYVSAQNLYTWTKYTGVDPEVSAYNSALTPGFDYSVYPRAKTITFGLNLNL